MARRRSRDTKRRKRGRKRGMRDRQKKTKRDWKKGKKTKMQSETERDAQSPRTDDRRRLRETEKR